MKVSAQWKDFIAIAEVVKCKQRQQSATKYDK